MRNEFSLAIGATRYTGWDSLRVELGLDQLAGSFTFTLSERFDGVNTVRPIRPGAAASVSLAGNVVLTGWVDKVSPQYDSERHSLSVQGRDATGDLVDCAAIHKSGHWHNQSLAQIAFDLVKPFKCGLEIIADIGKPFSDWSIEPGETVFENLDRAARFRGVLLYSDGLGNLVIGQPGTAAAPARLVLGENIESASGVSSELQRFSQYIVRAQQLGTDEAFGPSVAQIMGEAADAAIGRYRPTEILAENESDAAGCKKRAEWQRTVTAARAQQVVYTVNGWTANGKLWRPNTIVPVRDPFLGINENRLISRVAYVVDREGERTELTCVQKGAYDPAKLPEPVGVGGLY